MKTNRITMLIITLLLAVCMLAGCGGDSDVTPTTAPTKAPTQAPTTAPTQAPSQDPTQAPTQGPTNAPFSYEIKYVTDGLLALYEGACNTRDAGLVEDWDVWEDLSSNENDLEALPIGDQLYFSKDGLYIESQLIALPDIIVETVNAGEFTIELSFGNLVELTGTNWIGFIQDYVNNNDQLAFYYNVSAGELTLKLGGNSTRAKFAIDPSELANHTFSVTVSATEGVAIMYHDGVEVGRGDASNGVHIISLAIGHTAPQRCYNALYNSIRFYSRALTADEIAHNASENAGILIK